LSESGQKPAKLICTLSAISDQRTAANRDHIHLIQVPVQKPSTASKANIGRAMK